MTNGDNPQPGVIAAAQQAPAGLDPIKVMMDIAKDEKLGASGQDAAYRVRQEPLPS